MEYHELLAGFVRLHVLHHAAEGEVYGQWIIGELSRHGYTISPGTLYPMLQAMEARGTSRRARTRRERPDAIGACMSPPRTAGGRWPSRGNGCGS